MVQTASIVTTLKAPLRETMMFVNYHLNIGVSHMYLFFDDPNDECIEALADYKKVTCIRCDLEHWKSLTSQFPITESWTKRTLGNVNYSVESNLDCRQILNANYAFKLAQQDSYDWLIHIDVDELIYTKKPLDVSLSQVSPKIEVLVIKPLEGALEKDEYESFFEEVTLFKRIPWLWQKYLAYFLGCKRVFQEGDYFRGHYYGKSAIRTNANIKSVDIHYPIEATGHKLRAKRLWNAQLLHFDCCGFESWKRKWMGRSYGKAVCVGELPKRKKQIVQFVEVYETGDMSRLQDLYRQLYFFSSFEYKVLSMLGLLQRIQLNPQLFQYNPATELHTSKY